MILIYFDKKLNENVQIRFSGKYFSQLNDYCSKLQMKYDPKLRCRLISPKLFLNIDLINKFRDIDPDVRISEYILNKIKENARASLSITMERLNYNPDWTNFIPLKGKHPYEDYQIIDIRRFMNISVGGIFWEQGLGKNVFMPVHSSQLYGHKKINRILVLTPMINLYNLKREYLRFSNLFVNDDIHISVGTDYEPFKDNYKIIIMTYRHFLSISDYYYRKDNPKSKSKKYRNPCIPFDEWHGNKLIYLDESHAIANHSARQTKVLTIHSHFFKYKYLLSGTQADKPEKYYSQIKFLDDNLIPYSYSEWIQHNFVLGNRYSQWAISKPKPDRIKKFMDETVYPYCVKRLSEECLDLPEHRIKKIYLPLNDIHKQLYEQFSIFILSYRIEQQRKKANELFSEITSIPSSALQAAFIDLKSSLEEPMLLKKYLSFINDLTLYNTIENWNINLHSKIEMLDSIVEETIKENNEKLIIWDSHPETLRALQNRYKNFKPLIIYGDAYKENSNLEKDKYQDYIINEFQNNNDTKLLLASQLVMSESVTLTACNTQVYFQRDTKLTDWLQSRKRIHRNTQDRIVTTYVLILEDTLEVSIDLSLDRKEDINKSLLSRRFLSKEEVQNLLKGRT